VSKKGAHVVPFVASARTRVAHRVDYGRSRAGRKAPR
jgi:hypothetical protein